MPATPPRLLSRRDFTRLLGSAAILPLASRANAAETEGWMPTIGVQTSIANAALVKAAGGTFIAESVAGFIQPDAPDDVFEHALAAARSAPLPILGCNYFIGRKDLHCTGPEANHEAVLAYAERAFRRGAQLGVKLITFGSSGSRSLPAGFDQAVGKDQFSQLLRQMGPLAAQHGITIAVESLQRRECNFLTRIREVAEVVRRADHPHIRVAADLYHLVAENDTPEELAAVTDVLVHLEIAELAGRRVPGTTDQDFRTYFRVLKEARYRGAICFEGTFDAPELPRGLAEIARQWREA